MMGNVSSIRKLATEFRAAIERCPRAQLPIGFCDFPYGACGDATLILAKYLERNGHTGFVYVLGMRDGGSHAWLGRDDLVVDITADQFGDQHQPVIVESGSKWHELFRLEARDDENPVDFERYDRATVITLWNAYRAVVRQLR
jgi:hypothetical protein